MDFVSKLSIYGYAEILDVRSADEAIGVTTMLGGVIPLNGKLVQELVPRNRKAATSASLSKRYGRTAFPLHTDTAFWSRPARYIVFFMGDSSQTATRVLPLQDTQCLVDLARRSNPIFLRQTIDGAIYSRPWLGEGGGCMLYDPCYMQPANQAAKAFGAAVAEMSARVHRIAWTGQKVLIIDNWRVLHGRDGCRNGTRVLYRFYRGGVNELAA